ISKRCLTRISCTGNIARDRYSSRCKRGRSPVRELVRLEDDGLLIDEVGTWSEEKYRLVSAYASIFAASMRKKYDSLVYIDMYAGPGRVQIKRTTRIYASSPINALNIEPPFDRLIFCELEALKLEALRARCAARYPSRDVHF